MRGLLHMPPEQRLTSRAVLSHRWLRANSGTNAPPAMSLGLAGAVVDPACRHLVRLLASDYGYGQREVLEALRSIPETAVRQIGALALVTGLICVWGAFQLGL